MVCTTFMVLQMHQSCQSILFHTSFVHRKWPISLAWAPSKLSQGSWAYCFIKVDANLHQFTLPEGGCTKIKLMQKAQSCGILHQIY